MGFVLTGTYRQLFHPEQLISGKEDAASLGLSSGIKIENHIGDYHRGTEGDPRRLDYCLNAGHMR